MGTPVSYNNMEIAAEMTDGDQMTHRLIFHPAWAPAARNAEC